MSSLTLYDYWRSSAAHRVRIGLALKGLDFDRHAVNLQPPVNEQHGDAFRSLNPQMRLPALQTAHGMLTQSLAILEWLDETYPNPPFLPHDPFMRAQIRAFALVIACDIHPLGNVSVGERLKTQFGAAEESVNAWRAHWITRGFEALEAQLANAPKLPFVFADTPGLADICLLPQIYNARRFEVDLSPYPRLTAIGETALVHPAFIKAAPQRPKDR
jgi:maleylacetoacetate isomerase